MPLRRDAFLQLCVVCFFISFLVSRSMADELPDLPQLINLVDCESSESDFKDAEILDETMGVIEFDPDGR